MRYYGSIFTQFKMIIKCHLSIGIMDISSELIKAEIGVYDRTIYWVHYRCTKVFPEMVFFSLFLSSGLALFRTFKKSEVFALIL